MKESASIVIKNSTIVTMNEKRNILTDAAVVIDDTRITAVGPTESITPKFSADYELDAEGMVLLPGLINCHTHTLQCLGKGFGEDMRLLDWLKNFAMPLYRAATDRSFQIGATHACIESIRSGTTCLVDNIGSKASESMVDDIASSYQRAGVRALIARPIVLINVSEGTKGKVVEEEEKELKTTEEIVSKWRERKDDLVWVCPSPSAIYRVSPRVLEGCREISREYNVPVHAHIAEVIEEVESTLQKYGRREIEYIGDKGLLGPRFQAAHSIWLSDSEIDLLAETKSNVVHCPSSNMYIRSGVAKVPQMMEKGVNVTLGTDGGCVGNAHDMLELMKLTALFHKVNPHGQTRITPMNIIEMATINGAKAVGREHELGSIEVGKKADLFLMDLSGAHSTPVHDIITSVVFYSHSSDVRTVIINGKIVMEDGSIATVDETRALKETTREARELREKAVLGLNTH